MILTKILSAVIAVSALSMTVAQPFDNCSLEAYYQPLIDAKGAPENWELSDITDLVTSTQRNFLVGTNAISGGDDIFAALADLDRGTDPNNVLLLYRNQEIPADPAGTPQSWFPERLFPILRGATRESKAANDVFNLRAADTSVLLSRRGLLFYGECGTVNDQEACVSPATGETTADSAQDGKIITPPAVFRGDVARGLFYMQARYQEELGLFLTDCPPFEEGEFGYLSPLLEWATADVVTDAEIARNELACTRWQGNRNPFVDYPQLIEKFFGLPDTIREGTKSFSACTDETDSPTATPNSCSSIQAGDVMIFLENSDEPDQVVFFPLADIPGSVGSLYMTDNAWLGEELATNEGTVEFIIPEENGIKAGNIFAFGEGPFSELWADPEGLFDLSVNGDNIFLYCLDADDLPHFITGFSFAGDWLVEEDLVDTATSRTVVPFETSLLPEDLFELGSVALPHADNYLYSGITAGNKTDILAAFMNPDSYDPSDDLRYALVDPPDSGAFMHFQVLPAVVAATALMFNVFG